MTQSKGSFTPGPWFQDEAGICADGRLVAIIALPDECCGADLDSLHDSIRDELSANAALIAAAPQMLAALEECRRVLAMLTDPESILATSVGDAWAASVTAEIKVRKAILAATGQSATGEG
jgi:hypothetical protein